MAFWNTSEDPWDMDPSKRRPAVREEEGEKDPDAGSLLDDLRAWNEERKEKKARREVPPEPIPCPWCGGEMEVGYLLGSRDADCLERERPGLVQSAANWFWICRSRKRQVMQRRCATMRSRQTNTREKTDSWHSFISNTGLWGPARPPMP